MIVTEHSNVYVENAVVNSVCQVTVQLYCDAFCCTLISYGYCYGCNVLLPLTL